MIVKLVGNIGLIFEAGERLYSDFLTSKGFIVEVSL
jgi:hypothetical protein